MRGESDQPRDARCAGRATAGEPQPMIELDEISVLFAAGGRIVRAVDGVSLAVGKGEIFGIVGSSGAGKSTLLRTVNLLERPSGGRVRLDGEDVTDFRGAALRRVRQKIGFIFQHFNLMHTRTARENAAFALRAAGAPRTSIAARVTEVLDLVGLREKANAYPAQLSGGQKQRVGIARAIANHPEVLLCDEPTSALDPETAASILELLREINARLGITIVLICHEMSVIKAVCQRVAVMDAGRVLEQGDVYEVFATPREAFTRQLVERTFDLALPPRLTRELRGTLVRILFLGERAEEPVLSEATARFAVSINILHGRIEYIGRRAIGVLVALLGPLGDRFVDPARHPGPAGDRLRQAIEFIRANSAGVEVLHAG